MAPKTKAKRAKKKPITMSAMDIFDATREATRDVILALIDGRINAVRSLSLYSKRFDYETTLRHLKGLRAEVAAE